MSELVYFGATWCGPCNQVRSSDVWEQARDELDLESLDVDDDGVGERFKQYESTAIPTLVVKENGDAREVTGAGPVLAELEEQL